MTEAFVSGVDLGAFVRQVLVEDLGEGGDVTSAATIPADARFDAVMASRDAVTVAGLPMATLFFQALDPEVFVEQLVADGTRVSAGTALMRLSGNARALLSAERSALNSVQHLTGIATMTRAYVDAIAGSGGSNLSERQSHRLRRSHRLRDAAGADRLLLDNMGPETLREAVALVAGRVPTEASGGVRLDTIRAIAESGVTYVSVGRITQSAPAADIGLDYG